MPKFSKIMLLGVSVVLVLTIFLGVHTSGVSAASGGQDGAYRQIMVYQEVLHHIQSDYVEDPNMRAVTSGALRGLLESLDSDSSYLSAEDYKAYKEHLAGKAQVGINVSKRYGYATVVSVVPNGPADRAGLGDGDIIESIGTQSTRDLSLAVIQMMLDGAPGSQITLSVVRPRKAAPEKLTLTRAVTTLPSTTEVQYENQTILYLKPGVLDHEHVQQIEAKIKNMQKAGNKKILLDLRDVAAGDIAEGERLANDLLKSGTIAMLEGQKVAKQTIAADPAKTLNAAAPMVVLVNRGTAGAAEIVAAALADNKRADLVGEKTFGEGAQQKTFELQDGAALILSIAKYQTPNGKKIQDEGVTPATVVASAGDDAVVVDEDGAAPATAPAVPVKTAAKVDDQLSKALDMLKNKAA